MKKRILCFLMATLTLLCVACTPGGDSGKATEGSTSPPQTDAPEPETNIWLAQNGATDYRLVLPLDASDALRNASIRIRNRFESTANARIPIRNDLDAEIDCEILIGEVGRMERVRAASEYRLEEFDFVILMSSKKIIILGGSDDATVSAIDYFLNTTLKTDAENGRIGIPQNYIHISRAEGNGNMSITEITEQYLYFTLNAGSNAEINCRLNYAGDHGWRLLTCEAGKADFSETGASQQLATFFGETPAQTAGRLTSTQTDGGAVLTAEDGSRAEISAEPFSLRFYSPSGKLSASITDIRSTPAGTGLTGQLERGEAIFGTGERFDSANQRGKKLSLYALDEWNKIGGNGYMPIPLLISSRGSGIFINRYEPMTADLGAGDSDLWSIELQKVQMDCYIFASDLIPDVLYGYSKLSGFAEMPEDWTFGVLVCRYAPDFSTKEGIYEMIRNMEKNDLPWTGVIIEGWSIYDKKTYDDLKEVVEYVHSLGKKIMAYCRMGVVYTQWLTLPDDSYLVHLANGSNRIPDVTSSVQNPDASSSSTRLYLDLTNPAACDWFFGEVWGNLIYNIGLDGAKIDFCETFPESVELNFANGSTSGAHHWYPTYFNTLFYQMLANKTDGGMNFSRGGGIGSQRNPFMWAGDQTREFSRLNAALSAVLSSGLSGVPFMTYDMAGYRPSSQTGQKDDEATVFIRGTQMTAFTACIQTHGTVTRPYDFDEQTVALYRAYTKLHEILVPYIRENAQIATETGMPLVRHLVLQYQNDSRVYNINDEFLLGDGLLIAPVLDASTSRNIYLPQGRWQNLFTGEILTVGEEGLTLKDVPVPIEQIPVFINLDHTSETLDGLLAQINEIIDSLKGIA